MFVNDLPFRLLVYFMRLVCFDSLGVLIDISTMATSMDQSYPGQGTEISDLWRSKQLNYSRLRPLACVVRVNGLVNHCIF